MRLPPGRRSTTSSSTTIGRSRRSFSRRADGFAATEIRKQPENRHATDRHRKTRRTDVRTEKATRSTQAHCSYPGLLDNADRHGGEPTSPPTRTLTVCSLGCQAEALAASAVFQPRPAPRDGAWHVGVTRRSPEARPLGSRRREAQVDGGGSAAGRSSGLCQAIAPDPKQGGRRRRSSSGSLRGLPGRAENVAYKELTAEPAGPIVAASRRQAFLSGNLLAL
jgi:hypothetical protein